MRSVWKTILKLVVDVALTIGFFYAAILPASCAVGLAVACAVYVSSFLPGLAHIWPAGQSFLSATMLGALAALYAMLIFAIGIEILRRLIGRKPLWLYIAGAVAVMIGYMRPDGIHTVSQAERILMVAILLLAAAVGGTVYWLVAVKLRAVLMLLLRRLLCGAKPRAASCAFFEGGLR